jgi:cytochrome c oxidase subunit IV
MTAAQKSIARTAIILTALTALEFLIAFFWDKLGTSLGFSLSTTGLMKTVIFVLLTIVKAFYIVSEFMHLGTEVRRLIITVLIPFIFVIWLIIGMLIEGNYWGRLADFISESGQVSPAPDQSVDLLNQEDVILYG